MRRDQGRSGAETECWRYALERRGIKVSRSKIKYLCVNGGNDNETVKMEDTKVPRVKHLSIWNQQCKKVVVVRGR